MNSNCSLSWKLIMAPPVRYAVNILAGISIPRRKYSIPPTMMKNTMDTQDENDDMQGEITLVNREGDGPRDTGNQEEHHDRDHRP